MITMELMLMDVRLASLMLGTLVLGLLQHVPYYAEMESLNLLKYVMMLIRFQMMDVLLPAQLNQAGHALGLLTLAQLIAETALLLELKPVMTKMLAT